MKTDNGPITKDSIALIERAERGLVPAELGACEELLLACDRVERAAAAIRWVAIAAARRCPELAESPTGRGKRSPWIEWVKANYAEYRNEAHIHHMGAVGDLLIRGRKVCGKVCGDTTLFALPFDTLLALARLPEHLLAPILEKYDLAAMERSKVRRLVAQCLKSNGLPTDGMDTDTDGNGSRKAADGRTGKGKQLDFLDALFGDDAPRAEELYRRVEERANGADLQDSWSALQSALVASEALVKRVSGEASIEALALIAKEYTDQAELIRRAIEDRSK